MESWVVRVEVPQLRPYAGVTYTLLGRVLPLLVWKQPTADVASLLFFHLCSPRLKVYMYKQINMIVKIKITVIRVSLESRNDLANSVPCSPNLLYNLLIIAFCTFMCSSAASKLLLYMYLPCNKTGLWPSSLDKRLVSKSHL